MKNPAFRGTTARWNPCQSPIKVIPSVSNHSSHNYIKLISNQTTYKPIKVIHETSESKPSKNKLVKMKNRNLFQGHKGSVVELLSNNKLGIKYYFQTNEDKMLNKVRFKELQPSWRISSPIWINSRRISLASSIRSSRFKRDHSHEGFHQNIFKYESKITN